MALLVAKLIEILLISRHFFLQSALEVCYGMGYIVGPTLGALLFDVSLNWNVIFQYCIELYYYIIVIVTLDWWIFFTVRCHGSYHIGNIVLGVYVDETGCTQP